MTPGHLLARPPRVVAGAHDFQFLAPVEAAARDAGAVLRKDRWWALDRHDPARSAELIGWADVLLAEWCLGNAVHYARNRREGQRLVVRFHRFEYDHPYPRELDIDAVDLVVFAGPHFLEAAVERFGWPAARCVHVPNPVAVEGFTTDKDTGAERTLGLLGWHRKLKRLDLALDILERLREDDERFRLVLKGTRPEDVDWIWHDRVERTYFTEQLARIDRSPLLGAAVTFEGFGPVHEWFRRVGFVLSTSDVESFHLAAAEGMAAGAVPVILERPGADLVFPGRWIHPDASAAARAVLATDAAGTRAAEGEQARAFVAGRYGLAPIQRAWRRVLLDLPV